MGDCICAGDNRNGHSEYCPVWMKDRIKELETQLAEIAILSDEWMCVARDERARIIDQSLQFEDRLEANVIADEREDCAIELQAILEKK